MPDLFDAADVTRHEKAETARRELALRRRVYPRWIEAGRITKERADHEVRVMAAILADYAE